MHAAVMAPLGWGRRAALLAGQLLLLAVGTRPSPAFDHATAELPQGMAACSMRSGVAGSALKAIPACAAHVAAMATLEGSAFGGPPGAGMASGGPSASLCGCMGMLAYGQVYSEALLCVLPESGLSIPATWLQCQSRTFCADYKAACPRSAGYAAYSDGCDLSPWSPGAWHANGASPAENTLTCRLVQLGRARALVGDTHTSCHAASPNGGHVCIDPVAAAAAAATRPAANREGNAGGFLGKAARPSEASGRLPAQADPHAAVTKLNPAPSKKKGHAKKWKGEKTHHAKQPQHPKEAKHKKADGGAKKGHKGPAALTMGSHEPGPLTSQVDGALLVVLLSATVVVGLSCYVRNPVSRAMDPPSKLAAASRAATTYGTLDYRCPGAEFRVPGQRESSRF